ncbi:SusD/RagB family nutrient-binding outer membrane lipoprotein [candidate division KSB1 bacterium]
MKSKIILSILALSLAVFSVNCSDYLTGGILDANPNTADEVPLMSQFVALQPVCYGFYIQDVGVYTSMWMQQVAGISNQYIGYEVYNISNVDNFDMWHQMYMYGGLIDIRAIKTAAEEEGRITLLALTKIYEALLFATGADVFGDMPYSEAALTAYENPAYDTQLSVHTACIDLLDEAISALNGASDLFDDRYDFSFEADRSHMIAAAYSLKARILLNWAEVNNGNYALALAAAQNGIGSASENWTVPFENSGNHQNLWYQFFNERGVYCQAAKFFVDMMNADNDPRRPFYFDLDAAGAYSGSGHGEYNVDSSELSTTYYAAAGYPLDIISYEETLFMIAECQYNTGSQTEALASLNTALGVCEDKLGLAANSITRYTGLTGTDLLEAIMLEKFKALYLNPQVWNDWKRTGYPEIVSSASNDIPRRFMYPQDEYNTNTSAPSSLLGMWARNQNDPGDPTYLIKK